MAVFELDFDAAELGGTLEPDIDDLGAANDVTATRPGGSSARAVDEDGPLGVTAIGRKKTGVDVNPASDADLSDHAAWHLALGTIEEPRYPKVTVDLDALPSLATAASALDVGDLIRISNLPDNLAPGLAELVIIGYAEPLGSHRRTITFNTLPATVYQQVGVYGTASVVSRYDSANSTLSAGITSSATSLSVATDAGHALWVTGSSSPTFPFDIGVGGEQMTVTAISGASSPQTFTVTRSVNGVVKSHSSGASVRLWTPARYAL